MAAAYTKDVTAAAALDAPLAALHRDLFCEANPIPVKWALAKMGKYADSIRLPLAPLGMDYHSRVTGALQQANVISGEAIVEGSSGWPSRTRQMRTVPSMEPEASHVLHGETTISVISPVWPRSVACK